METKRHLSILEKQILKSLINMKAFYFFSIFYCLMQINVFANDFKTSLYNKDSVASQQNNSQELLLRRHSIYYEGNLLNYQEVMILYKDYPELSELYSTGNQYLKASTPLLISGIIGTSIGAVLAGSGVFMILIGEASDAEPVFETGYVLAILCIQMIPISILFKTVGRNKISGSVDRYNQLQTKSSDKTKYEYSFGIMSFGLGLQIRF